MEIKLKIFLAIFILIPPSITKANLADSGPVYIEGGEVKPINSLTILLTGKLNQIATYTVTCDIENQNYNKTYPAVLGMSVSGRTNSIAVNGQPLSAWGQAKLSQLENKYVANEVYSSSQLRFTSFDNSDTVIVKNCYATFMTN